VGYNKQSDWLMRVHCDAVRGTAIALSVFPPASSLLFSQTEYKQNYRAFKIQNLSESKKE
jgi:hypothetical protein